MFWCIVSLYIFTCCLYFDAPYSTARKNIQRYYTPKHLTRYMWLSFYQFIHLGEHYKKICFCTYVVCHQHVDESHKCTKDICLQT